MSQKTTIILATRNAHKVVELQRLMDESGFDSLLVPVDASLPDVEETGTTFEENAYIKAQYVFALTGMPVIADDSGLEVDILKGEPGVRSARYSGADATDASNRARLIKELSSNKVSESTGRFRCVLCYIDQHRTVFSEGACEGVVRNFEAGNNGFGYDPLFVPQGDVRSYAEMSSVEKDARSHRAQALRALVPRLQHTLSATDRSMETDPLPRIDALVMACVAAVNNDEHHLRMAIRLFVRNAEDATAMYEALLQTYLFAGFPVAIEALGVLAQEIEALNVDHVHNTSDFDVTTYRKRGVALLERIYSGVVDKMMDKFEVVSPDLADWMIVEGYGKTLSRPQLDIVDRELCVIAVLATLGRETQLNSHVRGALLVGATEEQLNSCAHDVTEWAGNTAGNRLRSAISRFTGSLRLTLLAAVTAVTAATAVLAATAVIAATAVLAVTTATAQQPTVKHSDPGTAGDSVRKAHRGQSVRELRDDINALISSPEWKTASIGISVLSLETGEPIVLREADRVFTPASVQKLFTTAVALDVLGPDYTFTTSLYLDGRVRQNGEFVGNIIMRGSGDPTWTEDFGRMPTEVIEHFVDVVDSLGIRSIRGALIGDDDVFDDEEYAPGWFWDDLRFAFAPEVSGINIANNGVKVTVQAPASLRDFAAVSVHPQTNYVRVISGLRTVDSTGVTEIVPYRDFRSNVIDLTGTAVVRSPGDSTVLEVSVDNPTLYAMTMFRDALVKRGIRCKGSIVDVDDWNSPISYDSLTAVSSSSSAPLSELITTINHISHNLGAECLFKEVAHRSVGVGSFSKASDVVRQWAEVNGIAGSQLTIVDGSGLSRLNLCTARQITALLMAMHKNQYAAVYRKSLAAPKELGTLKRRLVGTRAESAVRAKTGTMNNVSSLAGYVTTRDGEDLAFAIVMNGITVPQAMARNLQDLICMRLTSLARR